MIVHIHGDGVTDDGDGIRALVAWADENTQGCEIRIMPGDYFISDERITLPNGATIERDKPNN